MIKNVGRHNNVCHLSWHLTFSTFSLFVVVEELAVVDVTEITLLIVPLIVRGPPVASNDVTLRLVEATTSAFKVSGASVYISEDVISGPVEVSSDSYNKKNIESKLKKYIQVSYSTSPKLSNSSQPHCLIQKANC